MRGYFVAMLLVVTFFSGCACKVEKVTQIESSITTDSMNQVSKIEYIEVSPSYAPKNHKTRTITITNTLITQQDYSDYGDVLESEGSKVIDSKIFEAIKLSILDNNISICTTKKVDCNNNVIPEEMEVGCESQVLNLYEKDKKIFSEYTSCSSGKLCGNYNKVIHDIDELSSSIEMHKVDNKPIEIEKVMKVDMPQEKYKPKKITFFFASDKYSLDEKSTRKLEQFIDSLNKQEGISIRITGNTDRFGSQEYNYYKGLKRAKFVEKFFIDKGFAQENIISLSYGESNPLCVEITKECHAKNRRVDIVEIY